MVSSKKTARKPKRATTTIESVEPEVTEVTVTQSAEPIRLQSASTSMAWELLDMSPPVPMYQSPQQMVQWIDHYSRWKRKVASSKR